MIEKCKQLVGQYRHYKGNLYTVQCTAIHTETNELMVVYQAEYGEQKMFVRPLVMFLEMVQVDGQEIPRFKKI